MLVFEAKLEGEEQQYKLLDEAIRTARFIRNSCLRYWMDNQGIGRYELSAYCAVLAKEYTWTNKLNSMARQASAERALAAIANRRRPPVLLASGRLLLDSSITARRKSKV